MYIYVTKQLTKHSKLQEFKVQCWMLDFHFYM